MIKPIRPFPAILLRKGSERALLVADLHIGWELTLVQEGIHVPSNTPRILDKLLRLIDSYKPKTLIFLGDVKHTVARVELGEWRDIPDLFETLTKKVPNILLIPGNHDGNIEPLLPETVKIASSTGVTFWNVGLFHGHTWPAPDLLQCTSLIIGHVHPMVAFNDPGGFRISRQVWVKARCDGLQLARSILKHLNIRSKDDSTKVLQDKFNIKLRVSKLLIMPSFNDFLGGQSINRRGTGRGTKAQQYIGPILRSESVDINQAELYLLDGTFLGAVSLLKSF